MTEDIRNKADWHAAGFVPKAGEKPHEFREYGRGRYATLYRADQVRPLQKRTKKPPVELPTTGENVLAACWTVNRTAKRYRDAASSCYGAGAYQFATANRRKKEAMYALKDRALAWLIANEIVSPIGLHGILTVWQGSGYTFHSLMGPTNAQPIPDTEESLFVEAKPKTTRELRLRDACHLIDGLDAVELADDIVRRSFPTRERAWREEWEHDAYYFDDDDPY